MPIAQSSAAVHCATVLDVTGFPGDITILGFEAPRLVESVKPGQFVMLIPPHGEVPATALGVYEAQGERASLMFVACGPRTRELAALRRGAKLDLFGPLGNGFFMDEAAQRIALVSGGLGLASLLLPALAAQRCGKDVRLFYGARSADRLVGGERFVGAGIPVAYATDDGSHGKHGYVSDLLDDPRWHPDMILACGPTPMLRATARVAERLEIRAQLSLEENFGCGVGACWGCVVPIDRASPQAYAYDKAPGETRDYAFSRVCKEGPVYWAHELRW